MFLTFRGSFKGFFFFTTIQILLFIALFPVILHIIELFYANFQVFFLNGRKCHIQDFLCFMVAGISLLDFYNFVLHKYIG